MEWWHVYLFTRLTGLIVLLNILVAVGGVLSLGTGIGWAISDSNCKDMGRGERSRLGWEPWRKMWRTIFKVAFPIFSVAVVLNIAIPSQEQAAAIYLLPKLAHSDFAKEAQQIPMDAAKLIRVKLETWISTLDPTKVDSAATK